MKTTSGGKYVVSESPVTVLGCWAFVALSAYLSFCNGFKLWSVSGMIFFLVCAFSLTLLLLTRRQKLVIDAKGIHYTERCFSKVTTHHYPWSSVSRCYFKWTLGSSYQPFATRWLIVVNTDKDGNEHFTDIWLADFEFAFLLRHIKRAIITYSGNAGVFDEERTSANRKRYVFQWIIIFVIIALTVVVVELYDA